MDQAEFLRLSTFPGGLRERDRVRQHMACNYVVALDDPEKDAIRARMRSGELSVLEQRGLGILFGMVCGDAIGAPLEFSAVRYEPEKDFTPAAAKQLPVHLWASDHYNTFRLKPGQWTDDASMGFETLLALVFAFLSFVSLCLVDSVLEHPEFDPQVPFCFHLFLFS